jgi:hypothetical protein
MRKFTLMLAALGLVGTLARAEVPAEWKSCSKEIDKYCKGMSDSHEIMECIEKREKLGKKSGLSKACYAAHEKLEGPENEAKEKGEHGEDHSGKTE